MANLKCCSIVEQAIIQTRLPLTSENIHVRFGNLLCSNIAADKIGFGFGPATGAMLRVPGGEVGVCVPSGGDGAWVPINVRYEPRLTVSVVSSNVCSVYIEEIGMTYPEKMYGVVLKGHGGPEMLEWRDDLVVPLPGTGDVLVRVRAAGVNNTDVNTRTAWYSKGNAEADDATWSGTPLTFPRIQGADVCGEIVAVGEAIDSARVGQRILIEPCIREADGVTLEMPWYFGSECDGGFAQYTRVASRHAHAITSDLSDVELASFPCSYSTAENMLTRAKVCKDETILVTGASGGVGSATVQLAQARGANVIAVTSASKAKALLELGALKTNKALLLFENFL